MKTFFLISIIIFISAEFVSGADLEAYQDSFDKQQRAILAKEQKNIKTLYSNYKKSLAQLLVKVKETGDLNKTLAVKEEIDRFEKENSIPEKSTATAGIQELQKTFREQLLSARKEKAKEIVSLVSKYDKALDKLQKSYVKTDKLEDAKAVQEERTRVKENEDYKTSDTLLSSSEENSSNSNTSAKPPKKRTLPFTLKNDLVLYFNFDKKEADKVTDRSDKKNHGILKGPPTWTSEGKNGGAYHFDKKQLIIVKNSTSLNPPKGMTISVWVKPDSIGPHRRILQKGDTDKQYMLTGNCSFILYKRGTVSGQVLRAKVWNHIVVTYDGSVMRIFADGKKIAETKATGDIYNGGYDLHIGAKKAAGAFIDNFLGFIDEVMIYNRALSEKEVVKLHDIQK